MPTFGKTAVRNKLHLLKESIFSDEQEQIVIGYQIFNAVKLDNSGYITYGDFNDTKTKLIGNSVDVNAWGDINITTNANRITDGKGNIEISAPTKSRLNSGVNEYNKISIGLKDSNGTDFTKYIKFMINVTSGKSGVFIGSDNDIYLNADGKIINSADTELKKKLTVTGATALKSTLEVTGATTLKSTLSVDGTTTLNDKLTVTKNGADVTGASTFKTSLVVGIKDQDANNFHFKVYGKTLLYGHTDIDTGGLNVTGEVDITSGNLVVHENIKVTKSVTISGTGIGTDYALDVSGKSYFGNCINVYGTNDSYFEKGITTHGNIDASYSGTKTTVYDFEVKGTTTLNGKLTLKGGLEVTGDSKFNDNVTIGNNTSDDSTRRTLTVYGNIIGDRNLKASTLEITSSATIDGTLSACKDSSGKETLLVSGKDVTINGNETISGGSLSITSSGLSVRRGITAYGNILFPSSYGSTNTTTHKIIFGDASLNTFIEGNSSSGRISLSANDGIYLNTGSSMYLGTYDGSTRLYYINADGSVKFSTISATTLTASSATLSSLSIGGLLTVGGLTTLNSDLYFNRDKLSDLRKIRLVYSGTKDYAYISANKKYDDERSTYLNLYSTGYIIVDSFVFKVNNETSLNTVSIAGAATFKDSISILNDKYIKWIDSSNNQSAYIYTTCDGTNGKLKIGVSTNGLNSGIYFDDTIYFSSGDYYINTGGSAKLSTISGDSISVASLNIRNSTDTYLSVNSSGSSFYKDVTIGTRNSNASLTVNGELTVNADISMPLGKYLKWDNGDSNGSFNIYTSSPSKNGYANPMLYITYLAQSSSGVLAISNLKLQFGLASSAYYIDTDGSASFSNVITRNLTVTNNIILSLGKSILWGSNNDTGIQVDSNKDMFLFSKGNIVSKNTIYFGSTTTTTNSDGTTTIKYPDCHITSYRSYLTVLESHNLLTNYITVNNDLTVTGAATLKSTLTVSGKTTLESNLDVSGNTDVRSTLHVYGPTIFDQGIDNDGVANYYIWGGDSDSINGSARLRSLILKDYLTVTGKTTLKSDLQVGESNNNNNILLYGTLYIDNGAAYISSSIAKLKSIQIIGSTSFQEIKFGKKYIKTNVNDTEVYTNEGVIIGDYREYAGLSTSKTKANNGYTIIGNDCEMTSTLTVYDSTTLESSLTVTGAATLGSTLNVTGKTILNGVTTTKSLLYADGRVYLNNDILINRYGVGNPSIPTATTEPGQLYFQII